MTTYHWHSQWHLPLHGQMFSSRCTDSYSQAMKRHIKYFPTIDVQIPLSRDLNFLIFWNSNTYFKLSNISKFTDWQNRYFDILMSYEVVVYFYLFTDWLLVSTALKNTNKVLIVLLSDVMWWMSVSMYSMYRTNIMRMCNARQKILCAAKINKLLLSDHRNTDLWTLYRSV